MQQGPVICACLSYPKQETAANNLHKGTGRAVAGSGHQARQGPAAVICGGESNSHSHTSCNQKFRNFFKNRASRACRRCCPPV